MIDLGDLSLAIAVHGVTGSGVGWVHIRQPEQLGMTNSVRISYLSEDRGLRLGREGGYGGIRRV